jgi:hypothetical protein
MTGTPTTTLKPIIRFGVACPASGLLSKPAARNFFTTETQRHRGTEKKYANFLVLRFSLCLCDSVVLRTHEFTLVRMSVAAGLLANLYRASQSGENSFEVLDHGLNPARFRAQA